MSSLLNKAAVKRYLLDRVKEVHPSGYRYTRVSAQAYIDIEVALKRHCDGYLRMQRGGQTITTP